MKRLENIAELCQTQIRHLFFGKICILCFLKTNITAVCPIQTAQKIQQRAFPAAGRTCHGNLFAGVRNEIKVIQQWSGRSLGVPGEDDLRLRKFLF